MKQKKNITWQWQTFSDLSALQLYEILKLRQEVFVVEQHCAYLDCDDKDQISHHLLGWQNTSQNLVAYLRIVCPEKLGEPPRLGRLLTHATARHSGIGKQLVEKGVDRCRDLFPGLAVHISAQLYLKAFYEGLGFKAASEPYDEDGIPHISMKLHHLAPRQQAEKMKSQSLS